MKKKLPRAFYTREDVVTVSRELLGKILLTRINGVLTGGMITETEAYHGPEDRASHAFGGRRTQRTEIMYAQGGTAYVYLCYGIHHLFNVVTNKKDVPHAVLIRAIEPLVGIDMMLARRSKNLPDRTLTAGPGSMSQALGITTKFTGVDLLGDIIWIEDRGNKISPKEVVASKRIGVDYAGDHAEWHWRFTIRDNKWVSK
jgi:DNA-3-methyladenine glycosylase